MSAGHGRTRGERDAWGKSRYPANQWIPKSTLSNQKASRGERLKQGEGDPRETTADKKVKYGKRKQKGVPGNPNTGRQRHSLRKYTHPTQETHRGVGGIIRTQNGQGQSRVTQKG